MSNKKPTIPKSPLWQQIQGPFLTLATLIGLELLARTVIRIPNPPMIYITTVAYAGFSGGLVSGLVSAGITLVFALYFFSTPGQLFHYTPDNALRVIVLAIATPAMALMVGVLKGRTARMLETMRISAMQQARLAEQMRALHQATRVLTSDLRLEAVLQTLVETAQYLVNARYAALGVLDAEGKFGQFLVSGLTEAEREQIGALPHGRGMLGALLYEGVPLRLDDLTRDPRAVGFPPHHPPMKTFLGVPVMTRGKVVGRLYMTDKADDQPFTQEDEDLVVGLAADAAIAIENARLFAEVQQLAITDGLTGLYNRRHFFALAERELERARRYGHPLSVILLDLDHFKHVNDTYGHSVGDEALRVVAARCRECLRSIDHLGRYGGEEFAALLPENDLDGARAAAERLRQCIAESPVETSQGLLPLTISLGVAALDESCPDLATLLSRADAALYVAKKEGRNRVKMSVMKYA